MDWFDKLKGLVHLDLRNLKEIHLFSGNKIINNTYTKNVLTININHESINKNPEVLKTILRTNQENGGLIIESESLIRLADFKKIDSEASTQNFLAEFKGKIPQSDLEILRYSIYLKVVFNRGDSVDRLKTDIVERFGYRGRNICNLYSAGYFKSQIKVLYDLMFQQPDFSQEKFMQLYELIVTESPYAIFVSRQMTSSELLSKVKTKIETSKKYGINYLNIHGIGDENIRIISTVLEQLKEEGIIIEPQERFRDNNMLTVKLRLVNEEEMG